MSNPVRKFNIVSMALAAQAFCHFKNPATGQKMYAQKADENGNGVVDAQGAPVLDLSAPIGVKLYGPGSHVYQAAESAITTENIQSGKKKLTGEQLKGNAIDLLARTTVELVNFDYNGMSPTAPETFAAFYADLGMIDFREQAQETQGDAGAFLTAR